LPDHDIEANRIAAATLLRRALAGESLDDGAEWPDDSDDVSVEIALTALDEYLNDTPRDDDSEQYWHREIGRMADALSRGEALDDEQLSGWRGIDITWQVRLALVIVLVALVGWTLWAGLR